MTLRPSLSNFATNIEAKSSLERQYFWSAYVLVSFYQSYFKEVSSLCYGSFYRWSWMMFYPKCLRWALCVCSWDRMFLVLSLRDQSMFPVVVTRFPRSWRGQFTVILRESRPRVAVEQHLPRVSERAGQGNPDRPVCVGSRRAPLVIPGTRGQKGRQWKFIVTRISSFLVAVLANVIKQQWSPLFSRFMWKFIAQTFVRLVFCQNRKRGKQLIDSQ